MFAYITRQWKNRKITEVQVYILVPTYLTQAQADEIVAMPQNEVLTPTEINTGTPQFEV